MLTFSIICADVGNPFLSTMTRPTTLLTKCGVNNQMRTNSDGDVQNTIKRIKNRPSSCADVHRNMSCRSIYRLTRHTYEDLLALKG